MGEDLLLQRKETLKKLVHDPAYVPMKTKEIAMLLDIPREQRMELQEVLDILVAEGAVGLSKKGKYGKPVSSPSPASFPVTPRALAL